MRKLKETKLILESWNRFVISERNLPNVTQDQFRRIRGLGSDEETTIFDKIYGLHLPVPLDNAEKYVNFVTKLEEYITRMPSYRKTKLHTPVGQTYSIEKNEKNMSELFNYYKILLNRESSDSDNFFILFNNEGKEIYQEMYNKINWSDEDPVVLSFSSGDFFNSAVDSKQNINWMIHDFLHVYDHLENYPEEIEMQDELTQKGQYALSNMMYDSLLYSFYNNVNKFVNSIKEKYSDEDFKDAGTRKETFNKIYNENKDKFINYILTFYLMTLNHEIQYFTKGVGSNDATTSYTALLMGIEENDIENLKLDLHKDYRSIPFEGNEFNRVLSDINFFRTMKIEEKNKVLNDYLSFLDVKLNENKQIVKQNVINILKGRKKEISGNKFNNLFNSYVANRYKNKIIINITDFII